MALATSCYHISSPDFLKIIDVVSIKWGGMKLHLVYWKFYLETFLWKKTRRQVSKGKLSIKCLGQICNLATQQTCHHTIFLYKMPGPGQNLLPAPSPTIPPAHLYKMPFQIPEILWAPSPSIKWYPQTHFMMDRHPHFIEHHSRGVKT